MRHLLSLLVVPLILGVAVTFAMPTLSGVFFGVIAMAVYFAIIVVRASDWR